VTKGTDVDFSNKVALVTGAGSGIGRATSLAFARAGAAVACVDLDAAACAATAGLVREGGGEAISLSADVGDAASVTGYVAATLKAWDRIDAFANNAGYAGVVQPLVDYPDEEFDRVMRVNVRGVFLGLKHVLPVMVRQGRGAVVNTGSVGSFIGYAALAAYCASKHAVAGLTKSAALGVAAQGVRVNAVCPGSTETPMVQDIQSRMDADERRRGAGKIPLGRRAVPEQIAQTILFLASDHASHVTGQCLVVDGGQLAG
jgi:NAD(P)-dependent dehydrogenase (short-subunit alcohol dehydrogenase family)